MLTSLFRQFHFHSHSHTLSQHLYLPILQSIQTSIPNIKHYRMASTFPDLPIFRAIATHDPQSTAVIHSESGKQFTYGNLLKDVEAAKITLYNQLKSASAQGESIGGQRVAFLVPNSYNYVGASRDCFYPLPTS